MSKLTDDVEHMLNDGHEWDVMRTLAQRVAQLEARERLQGGTEHLAQVIANYQAQVAHLGRYINLLEDHIRQLGSTPPVQCA